MQIQTITAKEILPGDVLLDRGSEYAVVDVTYPFTSPTGTWGSGVAVGREYALIVTTGGSSFEMHGNRQVNVMRAAR